MTDVSSELKSEFAKAFGFTPVDELLSRTTTVALERQIVRDKLVDLFYKLDVASSAGDERESASIWRELERLWSLAEKLERLPYFTD